MILQAGAESRLKLNLSTGEMNFTGIFSQGGIKKKKREGKMRLRIKIRKKRDKKRKERKSEKETRIRKKGENKGGRKRTSYRNFH